MSTLWTRQLKHYNRRVQQCAMSTKLLFHHIYHPSVFKRGSVSESCATEYYQNKLNVPAFFIFKFVCQSYAKTLSPNWKLLIGITSHCIFHRDWTCLAVALCCSSSINISKTTSSVDLAFLYTTAGPCFPLPPLRALAFLYTTAGFFEQCSISPQQSTTSHFILSSREYTL